jgi:hypothetical protein
MYQRNARAKSIVPEKQPAREYHQICGRTHFQITSNETFSLIGRFFLPRLGRAGREPHHFIDAWTALLQIEHGNSGGTHRSPLVVIA